MAHKNKTGQLIKEARTDAGMTQTELARKVKGVTANDISKAERGEKMVSQESLKLIAKATGVTQKSLLDAYKADGWGNSSSSSSSSSSKKSSSKSKIEVTSAEKKLVEYYRAADTKTKKAAVKLLKGEKDNSIFDTIIDNAVSALTRDMPDDDDDKLIEEEEEVTESEE